MEEKCIKIISFSGERGKWIMLSGDLLARVGPLGYNIILRGPLKSGGNEEEKTKEDAVLKQLNKNAYNDLILAQGDTVCFQIVE